MKGEGAGLYTEGGDAEGRRPLVLHFLLTLRRTCEGRRHGTTEGGDAGGGGTVNKILHSSFILLQSLRRRTAEGERGGSKGEGRTDGKK